MTKNNSGIIWGVVTVLVVGGLFAWPILNDDTRPMVKAWKDAGLDCLSGHTNLAQHIHQTLTITVDGENESLAKDIGIAPSCMAEVHVHSGQPNVLHLETIISDKRIELGKFFTVYGKPIVREGYDLKMTINDKAYAGEPGELVLEDGQVIELKYISAR